MLPSIPDQAVLLSSFHVADPQTLTNMLENLAHQVSSSQGSTQGAGQDLPVAPQVSQR